MHGGLLLFLVWSWFDLIFVLLPCRDNTSEALLVIILPEAESGHRCG